MAGKSILIVIVVILMIVAGSIGFIVSRNSSGSIDVPDTSRNHQNNTNSDGSMTGQEILNTIASNWVLILSENNILVEGETGHNSDTLEFDVQEVNKLSIDMHLISELCVACGGSGKGEVTVIVILPSGDVAYKEVFTSTTDVNLLYDMPEKGSWQIAIDGIAYGSDYKVGYDLDVFVIE